MADENVTVTNGTEGVADNEPKTPTVEQLMAELASAKADKERIKNSLDKTLKEKGEITKALRAKQTAEEQLAEEQAEAKRVADEELETMRAELNRYKASSAYKNLDEQTIDKVIEAVSSADHNALAEIIRLECENAVRKAEAEWLNSRPQVATGNNGSTSMTREQIMAIKDDVERQQMIAKNYHLFK